MSKLLKGILLGVVVGAGAAAVEAYSKDRPVNELARNAALWGAGGAAAGALLGCRLGRCGRGRRPAKQAVQAKQAAAQAKKAVQGTIVGGRAHVADATREQLRRAEELTKAQRKAAMKSLRRAKAKSDKITRARRKAARRAAAKGRAKVAASRAAVREATEDFAARLEHLAA